MQSVVALALMAGVCLAIKVLWFPPPWLDWVPDRVTRLGLVDNGGQTGNPRGNGDEITVEWGLLTQPFIQRRLDAIAQELERLDREPDIFAKAFHTMVARSAHDALLADAFRAAGRPPRYVGQTFDLEVLGPSMGPREELEL
jgi:hypothetical protein